MEEVKQEVSPEKNLQRQMFVKFLTDASALLGNDASPLAFHVRVKIEEASYLGGIVIASQRPAPSMPVPPVAEDEKVVEDSQVSQDSQPVSPP